MLCPRHSLARPILVRAGPSSSHPPNLDKLFLHRNAQTRRQGSTRPYRHSRRRRYKGQAEEGATCLRRLSSPSCPMQSQQPLRQLHPSQHQLHLDQGVQRQAGFRKTHRPSSKRPQSRSFRASSITAQSEAIHRSCVHHRTQSIRFAHHPAGSHKHPAILSLATSLRTLRYESTRIARQRCLSFFYALFKPLLARCTQQDFLRW